VASYRSLTPQKRLEAMTKACAVGENDCDDDVIAQIMEAAADDNERSRMNNKATELREKATERSNLEDRPKFAAAYEKKLLDRHLNPDWVMAVGTQKRTLQVRGWFCRGKQFTNDFADHERLWVLTHGIGFRRMECVSALTTASIDFK
jgi:hypothetical protein